MSVLSPSEAVEKAIIKGGNIRDEIKNMPVLISLEDVLAVSFIGGCVFDLKERYPVHGLPPTLVSMSFFFFYNTRFSRENLIIRAVNILVILLSVRAFSAKRWRKGSREERIVNAFMKKMRSKYPAAGIIPATGLREMADGVDEWAVRQRIQPFA